MKTRYLSTGLVAAVMLTLTACTTVNPYTEQQQSSKASIGPGIGAVSGTLIGAMKEIGRAHV